MKVWAAGVLIGLLGLSSAVAQEVRSPNIFLGEVRSIVLTTMDSGWQTPPNASGAIVVSNSCGDEMVTFRVLRSIAAMRSVQIHHFRIGEWCQLPVEFGPSSHLVVPAAGPDEEPMVFPVLVSDQTEFAFVEDERDLQRASPEAIPLLRLQQLPQPVEYHLPVNLRDARQRAAIRNRGTLQIRDGKVWIVQGIPLATVFHGVDSPGH